MYRALQQLLGDISDRGLRQWVARHIDHSAIQDWIGKHLLAPLGCRSSRCLSRVVQTGMLGLLFAALIIASSLIVRSSAIDMIRGNALGAAESWAQLHNGHATEVDRALKGEPATSTEFGELGHHFSSPLVHRFRLFDRTGLLRYDSFDPERSNFDRVSLDAALPGLTRNILAGASLVSRRNGEREGEPAVIYDVFVALKDGNGAKGVLQVALDQTRVNAHSFEVAASTAMKLAVILAMAFGVPLLGFWLQVRRQDTVERHISFLAERDPLTSLPNRATFRRHVVALMERAGRDRRTFAIHHIDLDEFKSVNDALGQTGGDELLRAISRRLRETLRDDDELARLGGDEFAVLQAGVEDREAAAALAQRMLSALAAPFEINGERFHVSASIGVALAGIDADDAERLTNAADLALYFAKSTGQARVAFFEAEMHERLMRRRALEQIVKTATEQRSFTLAYQPVYDARTEALVGFEALVRLVGPDGANVSPGDFIPIAEENGLIVDIGRFVLEQACCSAAGWSQPVSIAVNLSPVQFREPGLVETVQRALRVSGLAPHRLELEVTEGLLLRNSEPIRSQLKALKELGVAIVLDDFGTGYSSLSYLWQFRFDKIKIDQSFVRALDSSGDVHSILSAMIALGRALKMSILAEGVETLEQVERLRELGCELFQGYFYARPMTAAKAHELVLAAGAASEPASKWRQTKARRERA